MRSRLTYVPLSMIEEFDNFIISKDEQVLDAVKARTRDYSMLTLLKLLYSLRGGSRHFSQLYTNSKIRMKRSFLNYLHLCVNYGFIKRERINSKSLYSITDKGKMMIKMFSKESYISE